MNNFERAINKWRAIDKVYFDSNNGLTRATMEVDGGIVTIQSDIKFDGTPVTIESNYLKDFKQVENLTIIKGGDKLTCYGDVTVSVPVIDTKIEPVTSFTPGAKVKWNELEYVLKAASTDKYRITLNTVYFESERIVATDGYRLHWMDGEFGGIENEDNYPSLIYAKLLSRIKSDFYILCSEDHALISYEVYGCPVMIKTDYVKGSFPNYRMIFFDTFKYEGIIPWDERLKKVNKDTIALLYKSSIKTRNGTAVTEFEIEGMDMPEQVYLNPLFLYDAMNGADAIIRGNASNTPIKVNDNAIIMPMSAEAF